MKSLLLVLLLASPAVAADGFGTIKAFQPDFANAKQCQPIDGRKVWRGQKAYFIQSCMFYTCGSGALDPENADAVEIKTSTPKFLASFKKACK